MSAYFAAPLLFLLLQPLHVRGDFFEVEKPRHVGVVRRIPGNHTVLGKVNTTVTFGCVLDYPTTVTKLYWWTKDSATIWDSVTGDTKADGAPKFTVIDYMSYNRTIFLKIGPLTTSDYGIYKCVFMNKYVSEATNLCIGKPKTYRLKWRCKSDLAKSIRIIPHSNSNPKVFERDSPVNLGCEIKPSHKYLKRKSYTRYIWKINGLQLWFGDIIRARAPPGAVFTVDRKKQIWNMTVPNSTLLFGHIISCDILFSRADYSHKFVIVEAPRPQWVKDFFPNSGYFGVLLIVLMIWMLFAVSKTGT